MNVHVCKCVINIRKRFHSKDINFEIIKLNEHTNISHIKFHVLSLRLHPSDASNISLGHQLNEIEGARRNTKIQKPFNSI